MATANPFDLLGDNETDDPSQLIQSAHLQKVAPSPSKPGQGQGQGQGQVKQAKLPTKPLPPSQAVWEAKNETGRGGSRGGRGGRDFGRGGGGRGRGGAYTRDYAGNENANQGEEGEGGKPYERRPYAGPPRGPYRGGRRGGFNNEERREGERPRRTYERRSGTGRGSEIKREGSGRGNWGTPSDEVAPGTVEAGEENEKNLNVENVPEGEDVEGNKEGKPEEADEKEPEDNEMTLEEYEKLLEEKRKALSALKTEERKVELDKEFQSMQQLSNKKDEESVFIKLGSDKDKKKEAYEKEKAKKYVSINEFLKPAEGDRYYNPSGRGRGRGRGRGGARRGGGSYGGPNRNTDAAAAPSIEDPGHFPTLGGK